MEGLKGIFGFQGLGPKTPRLELFRNRGLAFRSLKGFPSKGSKSYSSLGWLGVRVDGFAQDAEAAKFPTTLKQYSTRWV